MLQRRHHLRRILFPNHSTWKEPQRADKSTRSAVVFNASRMMMNNIILPPPPANNSSSLLEEMSFVWHSSLHEITPADDSSSNTKAADDKTAAALMEILNEEISSEPAYGGGLSSYAQCESSISLSAREQRQLLPLSVLLQLGVGGMVEATAGRRPSPLLSPTLSLHPLYPSQRTSADSHIISNESDMQVIRIPPSAEGEYALAGEGVSNDIFTSIPPTGHRIVFSTQQSDDGGHQKGNKLKE